jgi:thiamine pyrophosphate-dependent acetolactate synthase large subunit-like protein
VLRTGADQFSVILAAVGVKRVYGIFGDSLNGLTDGIRRQGKIDWVPCQARGSRAFAAGAEAHLTGDLAVWPRQSAPHQWALRLPTLARTPLRRTVCAGSCPSAEIGSGHFQETHPETECGASPRAWSRTLRRRRRSRARTGGETSHRRRRSVDMDMAQDRSRHSLAGGSSPQGKL